MGFGSGLVFHWHKGVKEKLPTKFLANQITISTLHLNLMPTQPFRLTPGSLQYLVGSTWKDSELRKYVKGLGLKLTEAQIAGLGDEANPYAMSFNAWALAADVTSTNRDTISYTLSQSKEKAWGLFSDVWAVCPSGFPLHSSLLPVCCLLSPFRHTFLQHKYVLASPRWPITLSQLHIKTYSQKSI